MRSVRQQFLLPSWETDAVVEGGTEVTIEEKDFQFNLMARETKECNYCLETRNTRKRLGALSVNYCT